LISDPNAPAQDLYAVAGFETGDYDPDIPPEFFATPPPGLIQGDYHTRVRFQYPFPFEHSLADRPQFQYCAIIRWAQAALVKLASQGQTLDRLGSDIQKKDYDIQHTALQLKTAEDTLRQFEDSLNKAREQLDSTQKELSKSNSTISSLSLIDGRRGEEYEVFANLHQVLENQGSRIKELERLLNKTEEFRGSYARFAEGLEYGAWLESYDTRRSSCFKS
jgi:hypothetical protein